TSEQFSCPPKSWMLSAAAWIWVPMAPSSTRTCSFRKSRIGWVVFGIMAGFGEPVILTGPGLLWRPQGSAGGRARRSPAGGPEAGAVRPYGGRQVLRAEVGDEDLHLPPAAPGGPRGLDHVGHGPGALHAAAPEGLQDRRARAVRPQAAAVLRGGPVEGTRVLG